MWCAYGLILVACMSLSACGGGTGRNTGDKAISQPAQETSTDTPEQGSDLFARYGCFTCHSLDGSVMYGPPLNELYMKKVTVVRQGKELTIVADRDYLFKAITDPDYEKVSGYDRRIMPEPVIPEDDLETLIDYLIGLGEED
jgi:mono/diheme cytochrome c family protein